MILYLGRKYLENSFVFVAALTVLPLIFGAALSDSLPQAIFWGGVFGAVYTYRRFHQSGHWPMYDNLLLPRVALLVICFAMPQAVNVAVLILW